MYVNRVVAAVVVAQLDVGLLPHAVQVLVQPVEQEGEQLLRVLLRVAAELRREAAHGVLWSTELELGPNPTEQAEP